MILAHRSTKMTTTTTKANEDDDDDDDVGAVKMTMTTELENDIFIGPGGR